MLQAVSGSTQRNFTIFKTILESGTDIDSDVCSPPPLIPPFIFHIFQYS